MERKLVEKQRRAKETWKKLGKSNLAKIEEMMVEELKALLLEGGYALAWTGLNTHFIFGLFGFATTVGLNVWINYGGKVGTAMASLTVSALLLMLAIVNDAVAARGHAGLAAGGSALSLVYRYMVLLTRSCWEGHRKLVFGSLGFAAVGVVQALRALADSYESSEAERAATS